MTAFSPYQHISTTSNTAGIIPTEYSSEVIKQLPEQSACIKMFRTIRMGAHTTVLPVLTGLATAAFVSEGAAITASNATWAANSLVAEKVAAIIPISKDVWNDSSIDLGADIMGQVVTAVAKAVDAAILHGTSKPTSWTTSGIITAAGVGAGGASSLVDYSTQVAASSTMAEIVSMVMAYPEADGYEVNGFILHPIMKSYLRSAKDLQGMPLYQPMGQGYPASLYGEGVTFCGNGGMAGSALLAVAGDMSKGVIGIRDDISVELLREATIANSGEDSISLAQNDMVALKFIFRLGWTVASNATGLNASGQYPFGILIP